MPKEAGLRCDPFDVKLPTVLAKRVDELHRRGLETEAEVSELQASISGLFENARDATLGDLIDDGRKLARRRQELLAELGDLQIAASDLRLEMLPAFAAHVERCEAERDAAIKAERERLAAIGIDASVMPAAQTSEDAAERQLQARIVDSDAILPLAGKVRQARERLRVLDSVRRDRRHDSDQARDARLKRTRAGVRIAIPRQTDPVLAAIAAAVGLAEDVPQPPRTPDQVRGLSADAQRVLAGV
ncbi:hypothetical protein KOR34_26090 [Posidoniimonas corsicana]|uniref:Uncharacterized protein n=2 Tax=Posidoniimonas corsicana TaxID=1938618 RepID=A0A5C5VHR7_9BACT|nr:hypothetical protein KOR34_26090 [Posidoniimonas corsicana]